MSVCLSVTRWYSVETAKRIIKLFSVLDSHTTLAFPYHTSWKNSYRDPPNAGVKFRGYEISLFLTNVLLYLGNDTRYSHSYYGLRIGNGTQAFESYHFGTTFNDLEWPLTSKTRVLSFARWHMPLHIPVLRPASQAGPVRSLRGWISVL